MTVLEVPVLGDASEPSFAVDCCLFGAGWFLESVSDLVEILWPRHHTPRRQDLVFSLEALRHPSVSVCVSVVLVEDVDVLDRRALPFLIPPSLRQRLPGG